MKKHNLDRAYGDDGVAHTGLTLSMGAVPEPVVLSAEDIEMDGWPVDEHGRGLTLLEVENLTKEERAA